MTRLREHFRRWVNDIETGKVTMLGLLWVREYPGEGGEERSPWLSAVLRRACPTGQKSELLSTMNTTISDFVAVRVGRTSDG